MERARERVMPLSLDAKTRARLQQINWKIRHQASQIFQGEYRSRFRGQGMEFEDFRVYQPGDDIRHVDWKVTARKGTPYLKTFREERELKVFLAIDMSSSLLFGHHQETKHTALTYLAACLAYVAEQNRDQLGWALFAEEIIQSIPSCKGHGLSWRLMRDLLKAPPQPESKTDLKKACEFLLKTLHRRSVVILMTDLQSQWPESLLAQLAQRHELIVMILSDPREEKLPAVGFIPFQDLETQTRQWIDSDSSEVRQRWQMDFQERHDRIQALGERRGFNVMFLSTDRDPIADLASFFQNR